MTDDELNEHLRNLAPEPGADYWSGIDAALRAVEREANGTGPAPEVDPAAGVGTGAAAPAGESADTDGDVIRLTDMTTSPVHPSTPPNRRISLLAVAAAVVAVLAAGAVVLAATRDRSNDIATDPDQTETTPPPDDTDGSVPDGSVPAESVPDGDAPAPVTGDDDGDQSIAPTTTCYRGDEFTGEVALRLVMAEDGTATAVQRFVPDGGDEIVTTAVGRARAGDSATLVMAVTDQASGEAKGAVWQVVPTGLSQAEDVFLRVVACAQVADELAGIDAPPPNVPDAVLPAGSRTCWSPAVEGTLSADLYRIDAAGDGTASLLSYRIDDLGLVEAIGWGTGVFVTDNDIAFDITTWTLNGATFSSQIYVVDGSSLQPTDFIDWLAEETSCDDFDAVTAGPVGIAIAVDESIEFAPGTSGAAVRGAVVRGERDRYTLEAGQWREMTVEITSTEDNAVVDVYSPEGELIVREATAVTLELPWSGTYQIIVGGTRGNASYELAVEIN